MVRALNPTLNRFIAQQARTQERTRRFTELVRQAMRQTGRLQVELNPCDIWTAEEIISAARMARQPLSLQLGGRDFSVTLRNIRTRCPSNMMEWDYDMSWGPFRDGQTYRGTVTLLGRQSLTASLDQADRPIFGSICYQNFEVLRIDVPQALSARFGLDYVRQVPGRLLREASALPLCINMLGLPVIGIG